jgi:hypothetical protein
MTEIFKEFQEFRKILCICPCCGDIVRISDLKLKIKDAKGGTWLDAFDKQMLEHQRLEEKFENEKAGIRRKLRKKAEKQPEMSLIN